MHWRYLWETKLIFGIKALFKTQFKNTLHTIKLQEIWNANILNAVQWPDKDFIKCFSIALDSTFKRQSKSLQGHLDRQRPIELKEDKIKGVVR